MKLIISVQVPDTMVLDDVAYDLNMASLTSEAIVIRTEAGEHRVIIESVQEVHREVSILQP